MTPEHARTFARYNRWANARLYAAVAALPDDNYRRDLGAFFGSLQGTLNHILVADLIWLGRLGLDTREIAPTPAALDSIVFEDLGALGTAREVADQRIVDFCDPLTSGRLAAEIAYRRRDETHRQPLWQILAHLFNHQTHHRGQAHAMLTHLGRDAPPLDLIYCLREAA